MKLTDLDPKLTASALRFRCPCGEHQIRIPVAPVAQSAPPVWSAVGDLVSLTVRPSIAVRAWVGPGKDDFCNWHGYVTSGEVHSA